MQIYFTKGRFYSFISSYQKYFKLTQPGHPSVDRRNEYEQKWTVNKHTARCTTPVSVAFRTVVSQCN